MITTAKASQKALNQYIEMYQMVIDFELEKMGITAQLKHNKADSDQMFDVINDQLIKVCDEYIKNNSIGWDKFQLATVVMKLFTQAVSECEAPFKVIIKETKKQVQEYLEKNKEKRETLERIKRENKELDKKISKAKQRAAEVEETPRPHVVEKAKANDDLSTIGVPIGSPVTKTKKYNGDVYQLATKFTF